MSKKGEAGRRRGLSKRAKLRRKKRIIVTVFSLLMVLMISASCVAMKVIYDVGQTMGKVYDPVEKEDMRAESSSEEDSGNSSQNESSGTQYTDLVQAAKPISILLIGTDTGDFGRTAVNGLSDVLIYCVLNPATESLTMLSIPRDTYTEIVGYGTYDKINAAYQYGGAQMTINTVQNLLGVPVDAYAAVNFAGFQAMVDAIGGVTVENSFAFSFEGYSFPEGTVTLGGADALAFCRMRYNDPEGDFGRGRRQRNVILAMANKATTLSSALNYQELLNAVSDNVLTDIDLDSALEMISQYSVCLNNVTNMDTLKGYDDSSTGVYYYRLDEQNLAQITAQLRSELELN